MYTTSFTANAKRRTSMMNRLENLRIVMQITELYSAILGQTVTPRFTLTFIHAQTALMSLCMVNASSLLVTALLFLWFIVSAMQCRSAAKEMSPMEEDDSSLDK